MLIHSHLLICIYPFIHLSTYSQTSLARCFSILPCSQNSFRLPESSPAAGSVVTSAKIHTCMLIFSTGRKCRDNQNRLSDAAGWWCVVVVVGRRRGQTVALINMQMSLPGYLFVLIVLSYFAWLQILIHGHISLTVTNCCNYPDEAQE